MFFQMLTSNERMISFRVIKFLLVYNAMNFNKELKIILHGKLLTNFLHSLMSTDDGNRIVSI